MNPITAWLTQFRIYLELAAGVIVIGLAIWFVEHERSIGAEKIEASDAKAQVLAQALAAEQTQHNVDVAAAAARKADDSQKAVDAYAAAHPSGPVSLCYSDHSLVVVSPAGAAVSAPAGPSAGPAPVREVQDGVTRQGPDVAGELDALVSAAAAVDGLYQERQQR